MPTLTQPYTRAEQRRRKQVLDDTRVRGIEPTKARAAELQRMRDLENENYILRTAQVKLEKDLQIERGLNDTLIRDRDRRQDGSALAAVEVLAQVPVKDILRLGLIQSVEDLLRWRDHIESLNASLAVRVRALTDSTAVPVATDLDPGPGKRRSSGWKPKRVRRGK